MPVSCPMWHWPLKCGVNYDVTETILGGHPAFAENVQNTI